MVIDNSPAVIGRQAADYMDFEHTGPGTLAGRYLRTFWHPIARAEDLAPDRALPITIMSDDFTLYRGESGIVHLVGFRCAHRGTQLSSGWIEGDCIRCRYHGWKYDGSGQCVEQPMEDGAFASRVRIPSYPVQEYLGLIFAFLGEGEAPPLPRYPEMEQEGVLECERYTRACNTFNELENDPGHGSFTHRDPRLPKGVFYYPEITIEPNSFGFKWYQTYPNGEVQVSQIGMPNVRYMKVRPRDPETGWRTVIRWKVPIDDVNHLGFAVDLTPATGEVARRYRERRQAWFAKGGKIYDSELSNEILAGRLRLEDIEFREDLNVTAVQDDVTQIGQGRIRDRAVERLGRSDEHVVMIRKLWAGELQRLAEGRPLTQWTLPEEPVLTEGYERELRPREIVLVPDGPTR